MFVSHRSQFLNEQTRDSIQSDRLLVLNKAGAHRLRKPHCGFLHTDIISIFPDHLGLASGSGTRPPGRGAASDFMSRLCQLWMGASPVSVFPSAHFFFET